MDVTLEVVKKMHEDTNHHLETLSARIGYDFNLSVKRTEVSSLLDDVIGLSKKHKFLACDILVKELECLDLFKMSKMDKFDYVIHILEKKLGVN
ncbi:hypothetical protein AAHA92_31215 [Salvia divinorum]|uniref:Uncharacterized protein n=1 Tax=Salvia divinorum TaxID=28513 RepID=A0ABD1FTZ1_SALDI